MRELVRFVLRKLGSSADENTVVIGLEKLRDDYGLDGEGEFRRMAETAIPRMMLFPVRKEVREKPWKNPI